MAMIPLLVARLSEEDADMGDLEFLRDKQVAGDLIIASGVLNTTAPITIATIVPAIGKTFYVATGDIGISTITTTSTPAAAEVQNDGGRRQTLRQSLTNLNANNIPISVKSDSLIGDGAKEYRIEKITGNTNIFVTGTIEGWVEDT